MRQLENVAIFLRKFEPDSGSSTYQNSILYVLQALLGAQEMWRRHAQSWEQQYLNQKQTLDEYSGKILQWCEQHSGRWGLGVFVDRDKKEQVARLCKDTREWLQERRSCWTTTYMDLQCKLQDLEKQKEDILHPPTPALRPASTTQRSSARETLASCLPTACVYPYAYVAAHGSKHVHHGAQNQHSYAAVAKDSSANGPPSARHRTEV